MAGNDTYKSYQVQHKPPLLEQTQRFTRSTKTLLFKKKKAKKKKSVGDN